MIYDDKKFEDPLATLIAFDNAGVIAALGEIEKWQQTYYLVGYIRYEAKDVFLGKPIKSESPLLYFQVFEGFTPYVPKNAPEISLSPQAQLTSSEYAAAISEIKQEQRG